MKQPTHNFNLEFRSNSSGKKLIYFYFNYGFKEFNPTTKKYVYPELKISSQWTIDEVYWDGRPTYRANKTYVRKFGKDLNSVLDKIQETAYNQLSLYRNEYGTNPNPKELKKRILEKLNRIPKQSKRILLVEYIKKLIDKRTNLPISSKEYWGNRTKIGYENLINHIEKYEERKKLNISLDTMTEELYWDYFKTINDIHKEENGTPYIRTTIAKDCKNLKAIFNCAIEDDIEVGFNFSKKGLKIHPSKPMYETYLTNEQLEKIIKADVSHSAELQRAKEYIVISSFTGGLRIGDMKHLHELKVEVIESDGKHYNTVTTKIRKSKENQDELIVTIPILKPVNDILKKYQNKFPKLTSDTNVRKCVTKLLKHLKFENEVLVSYDYYLSDKVIYKKKKQHSVFSPHDCRRTYITNLKQLGIQNDTIEPITHPKMNYKSVLDSYDKSTLKDKAIKLIKAIESSKSKLYKI